MAVHVALISDGTLTGASVPRGTRGPDRGFFIQRSSKDYRSAPGLDSVARYNGSKLYDWREHCGHVNERKGWGHTIFPD